MACSHYLIPLLVHGIVTTQDWYLGPRIDLDVRAEHSVELSNPVMLKTTIAIFYMSFLNVILNQTAQNQ